MTDKRAAEIAAGPLAEIIARVGERIDAAFRGRRYKARLRAHLTNPENSK